MIAILTGALYLVLGLGSAGAGVRLIAQHGPWAIALLGTGVALTGAMLMIRQAAALAVYTLVVLGTLVWAMMDVGPDWWRVMPRADLVMVMGLWLLAPFVTRTLRGPGGAERTAGGAIPKSLRLSRRALAASLLAGGLLVGMSLVTGPQAGAEADPPPASDTAQ